MRLHSPVLVTRNLAALRAFYVEVLGLTVTDDFGACIFLDTGLSLWAPGPDHPVHPPASAPAGHAFELCFEAETPEEFDAVCVRLRGSGAPLLHEVREEPWGQRTIRLLDPDGNLLEWGESIPCFVRRLASTGLDPAAVARRTGVAVDRVRALLG